MLIFSNPWCQLQCKFQCNLQCKFQHTTISLEANLLFPAGCLQFHHLLSPLSPLALESAAYHIPVKILWNVLYMSVLYFTVLPCLCCLYCTVLYCTVLYCTVLYYTVLYCTVLYCTAQHCISILYCAVLSVVLYFNTELFRSAVVEKLLSSLKLKFNDIAVVRIMTTTVGHDH